MRRSRSADEPSHSGDSEDSTSGFYAEGKVSDSPSKRIKKARRAQRARNEGSLSVLTNKFIRMLEESQDGVVDLNDAVEALLVQKRRIYDITNVLEGIGYIKKLKKNKIRLVNQADEAGLDEEASSLEAQLTRISEESVRTQRRAEEVASQFAKLFSDSEHQKHAFIDRSDLENLMLGNPAMLPCVLVESSVDTLVDIYQPKKGVAPKEDLEFTVFIKSDSMLNLYYLHTQEEPSP